VRIVEASFAVGCKVRPRCDPRALCLSVVLAPGDYIFSEAVRGPDLARFEPASTFLIVVSGMSTSVSAAKISV
jgi:hypothetical protein